MVAALPARCRCSKLARGLARRGVQTDSTFRASAMSPSAARTVSSAATAIKAAAMLEAAGAKNVHLTGQHSVPGFCIHEIGTARMGADPKTSVVSPFCQAHDVENIFVTDGACWVSSGCQNPTLTMMAITVRAC